jgi:hypothetical protein
MGYICFGTMLSYGLQWQKILAYVDRTLTYYVLKIERRERIETQSDQTFLNYI